MVTFSLSLAEWSSLAVAAVFSFGAHKLLVLLRSSAVMSFNEQFRGFPNRKKFLKGQKSKQDRMIGLGSQMDKEIGKQAGKRDR